MAAGAARAWEDQARFLYNVESAGGLSAPGQTNNAGLLVETRFKELNEATLLKQGQMPLVNPH